MDLDFGTSVNLIRDGSRSIVGAGQKSGVYHAAFEALSFLNLDVAPHDVRSDDGMFGSPVIGLEGTHRSHSTSTSRRALDTASTVPFILG